MISLRSFAKLKHLLIIPTLHSRLADGGFGRKYRPLLPGTLRVQLLPLLFLLAIVSPHCNGANNGRKVSGNNKKAADSLVNPPTNSDSKTMVPTNLNQGLSDWIGMPLSKMIGTSELIVYGSVKKIMDSSILVQVKQKIAGVENEPVIEMIKAKADPFASIQPAPYKIGQCYLLFLSQLKTATTKKQWKLMGHAVGQESQMPVIDGYIYFIDRYFEGIPQKEYDVNGVRQNIQRFEFSPFVNAVEGYTRCYQWMKQQKNNRELPQQICTEEQAAVYAKKGFMHQYLVTETRHFITGQ
ncbi:MAG: hypothetical protein JWP81_1642 [Ferruginibacter sp.]|nr:hypothetical protein [Ferruginibacter sp.]